MKTLKKLICVICAVIVATSIVACQTPDSSTNYPGGSSSTTSSSSSSSSSSESGTGNEGGNTGNEGGNTGNEGGNTGNEGGNTGNEGGNTGNEGGNTGNEGGNTEPTTYTVTFKQDGQSDVVITVDAGGSIESEDLPTPVEETGYDIAWNITDFTDIQSSITVTAVKTPKEFTITFDLGVGSNYATLVTYTQTVRYGEEFTLPTPTLKNPNETRYSFKTWKNKATGQTFNAGTWTYLENIELRAEWKEEFSGDF